MLYNVIIFIVVFIISLAYSYAFNLVIPLPIRIILSIFLGVGATFRYRRNWMYRNLPEQARRLNNDPILRTTPLNRRNSEMEEMRLLALTYAKPFLSPFDNIWKNLRLSNKFCILMLSKDGKSISGIEKVDANSSSSRSFYLTKSDIYSFDELWNRYCTEFGNNTTYDNLVRISKICQTDIKEAVSKSRIHKSTEKLAKQNTTTKLVDINNCSEIEMTALPGINVVFSKKAIKKREEIGGFKSVDDFFEYLNIKPRMREQLKDMICANKMKGTIKIVKSDERTLDL